MILNALAAAFMLLWVNITPANVNEKSVEPATVEAPAFVALSKKMTKETERILIEDHAAPHWELSTAEAWDLYNMSEMTIDELEEEVHYIIHYDGTILEILLEE